MIINKVNLTLTSGRVYGFHGINGSGKTMLMRLIAGLIYPTAGSVTVCGKDLAKTNSFPKKMGVLLEHPAFLNSYSGFQNLKLLAGISDTVGETEIKEALVRMGLDPEDRKKYRAYSLGMKQRLGLACAIMERPELIILDEPTNSLDEDGIRMVESMVQVERKRGALIVVSCHDHETLSSMSDELYRITAGEITSRRIKNEKGIFTEEGR